MLCMFYYLTWSQPFDKTPETSSSVLTYLSSTEWREPSAKISRSLPNICTTTKCPPTVEWRKTGGHKQEQMLFFVCFFSSLLFYHRRAEIYNLLEKKNPIARQSTVLYQLRCFWLQILSTSTLMANKKGNLHFITIKVEIKTTFSSFPSSSSCCSLKKN